MRNRLPSHRLPLAALALLLPLLVSSPALAADRPPDTELTRLARSEGKVVIADFGIGTCKTCKQQKVVLDNIARDYEGKVVIRIVNIYKEQELAAVYEIQQVPTLLFFSPRGEIFEENIGGLNYLQIAETLKKAGVKP
jgi:thioredoxin-like negative regulator of GroEL